MSVIGIFPSIPVASFHHRQRFYDAKQGSNESISEWYNRLLAITIPCEFGLSASFIILDKFVFGLEEKYLRRLGEEVGELTLEQSIRITRQLEVSGYQNQFADSAKLARPRSSRSCEIGPRGVHVNSDDEKCDNFNSSAAVSSQFWHPGTILNYSSYFGFSES